ncbi:hypothetical protein LTR95_003248 [Oleoguttula sp. CCFEE 5521]
MIADRKRKWGINDKNSRKIQRAGTAAETFLPEVGFTSTRPIMLADDGVDDRATTPDAAISSSMLLTSSVNAASLFRPMDHPAPPPAPDSSPSSPSSPPVLNLSNTARPTSPAVDEDVDSDSGEDLIRFPPNRLVPSVLEHTALGTEVASAIAQILSSLGHAQAFTSTCGLAVCAT